MADTPTSQLPRLRTYARDLESERQRRGMPSTPVSNTPTKAGGGLPPVPKPPIPTTSQPTKGAKAPATSASSIPAEHLVVAPPWPERASEAVFKTREDELRKERDNRPTTVPPFHTLKAATRAAPAAVVRENTVITIDNDESAATVITDTKRDRFSVRRSLFASIRDWWTARAKARKASRAPKYVVPETDRRKGVIQRATSHTGKQVTGDHDQLRDLIRERTKTPAPVVAEPETIWTPNTETIFPLLEAPEGAAHFSNVTVTPRGGKASTPPVATTPPAPAITAPVVRTPKPAPPVAPVEPPAPEVAPPAASAVEATLVAEPEPEREPEPTTTPFPSLTRAQSKPRRFETNTLALGIVGILVVLALGGLGLRAYLTPPVTTPVLATPLPLNLPLRSTPLSEGTREALLEALTTAQNDAILPQQLLQVQNDGNPVDPAVLLTLLSTDLSPQLISTVRSLYFGWHERSIPFVVMTVSDQAQSWGSLLSSETVLINALAPLITSTSSQSFVDTQISNRDVRRYQERDGRDVMVYGMIDDSTLLITRDQATFQLLSTLATDRQ